MAVSKRTRYEVLKRDNYTCRYCRSAENPITVDHVVPIALGGTDEPSNLVAACRDCNYGKASAAPDGTLVDDVKQDAFRWAQAMKLAIEHQLTRQGERDQYFGEFVYAWEKWMSSDLYGDWETTVNSWWRDGVPEEFFKDAIFITAGKRYIDAYSKMQYVAGIVRNKMQDAREKAAELLAEESVDGP